MIDKRAFTRIHKKALVSFDVLDQNEDILDKGMARATDMSERGLHLELPRKARVGDRLRITLSIDNQIVTIAGTLAWVESKGDQYHVGMKIEQVPAEYRQVIESLTNPK